MNDFTQGVEVETVETLIITKEKSYSRMTTKMLYS